MLDYYKRKYEETKDPAYLQMIKNLEPKPAKPEGVGKYLKEPKDD